MWAPGASDAGVWSAAGEEAAAGWLERWLQQLPGLRQFYARGRWRAEYRYSESSE